jgi:DNA polymerase (family 10)
MTNREVARIFMEMADILAIQGENPYRVNAYRRAAETIAALGQPLEALWREGALDAVPGIGETLANKIDELLRTGRLEAYERLRAQVPGGVVEMLQVPEVGPKRAALFWKQLGITSIAALEEAARAGRLAALPGMGGKSEQKVLAGIEALKRRSGRLPLGVAWPLARAILGALADVPGVVQAAPAGSLRRMRETVGDIDLLVALRGNTDQAAEALMARFHGLPQVAEVLLSGPTKTSVRTHEGVQVDLRVLEPARWGTALQYFTGSQAHNIHLRGLALERGYSLSEYALKRTADESELLCATEEEVYAALGLPLIPPELREDRGEIQAALEGRLPALVELEDLQGDLHVHSTWSDGHDGLLEMARAAQAVGLRYLLVADHSQGLGIANGLSVERLRAQRAEIERLNRKLGGDFRLLAGSEVEIRADGSLDYPDEVLAELDVVVASLHSGQRQERETVTARMLAAIRNPHVDIIAHPTGREIEQREAADLDLEAVFRAAAETGTALEVNAHPERLDLSDGLVRRAIELGVKLAISSDAHSVAEFDWLPLGVATARRGWATAADVINTWPVERLLAWARREAHHV